MQDWVQLQPPYNFLVSQAFLRPEDYHGFLSFSCLLPPTPLYQKCRRSTTRLFTFDFTRWYRRTTGIALDLILADDWPGGCLCDAD